jgi:hypothetical protein
VLPAGRALIFRVWGDVDDDEEALEDDDDEVCGRNEQSPRHPAPSVPSQRRFCSTTDEAQRIGATGGGGGCRRQATASRRLARGDPGEDPIEIPIEAL